MKKMVKHNSATMPERYLAIRVFAIDESHAPLTSALLALLRFEEDSIRRGSRLCRAPTGGLK
jgi:hypothetical protein